MKNIFSRSLIAIALTTCMTVSYADTASSSQDATFTAQQKQAIENVIHDYLVENPEILIEASQALQKKQAASEKKNALVAIKANFNDLFHDANTPIAGNPDGDIYLVEFYDYQCGHCKQMSPVLDGLIRKNANLKVVYKDFPIFGENSEYAAKASIAAYKIDPHKYLGFHAALSAHKGALSSDEVLEQAKKAGYEIDEISKQVGSQEIADQLKANYDLAKKLKLMATPIFILSNKDQTDIKYYPGAVPGEKLQQAIDELKK